MSASPARVAGIRFLPDEIADAFEIADAGDARPAPRPTNTELVYLYRDAGNWKTEGRAIFAGACTPGLRKAILDALEPGIGDVGGFVPSQVGLPDLQPRLGETARLLVGAILAAENGSPASQALDAGERRQLAAMARKLDEGTWDPELDHPFHEIVSLEATFEAPTDPRAIEVFAAEMAAVRWDHAHRPEIPVAADDDPSPLD